MPIYEYKCKKCGHRFEELCRHGQKDIPCPVCGGAETCRLISAFSTCNTGDTGASGGKACTGCAGGNCSSCH